MKLITALTFLLATSATFCCQIELPQEVILVSKQITNYSQINLKSNCPTSAVNYFWGYISKLNGDISASYLQNALSEETNNTIVFNRNKIKVSRIENVLQSKLLTTNLKANDTKIISNTELLLLEDEDQIAFECDKCETVGKKNIKAIVSNPISQKHNEFWLTTTISSKSIHIVAKRKLSITNELDPKDFDLVERYSAENQILSLDLESLKYYKLSKNIDPGQTLMPNQLIPINLVQRGISAKVVYSSPGVTLSGTAIPTQNGKINDIIQVEMLNGNKKISAKVVDINKVQVNL